ARKKYPENIQGTLDKLNGNLMAVALPEEEVFKLAISINEIVGEQRLAVITLNETFVLPTTDMNKWVKFGDAGMVQISLNRHKVITRFQRRRKTSTSVSKSARVTRAAISFVVRPPIGCCPPKREKGVR